MCHKFTPELDKCEYYSDEYKKHLEKVRVALDHHYTSNSHHPEHYENGIHGMDLMDVVEMICDWLASTIKHEGSNASKSIEINKERFNYSDDIESIFKNTINHLNEIESKKEKKAI